jgi:transcriptional/translational regulatory protein YebC/TACO1
MKAETENELKGPDGEKMRKILDFLEDLDDVQEVYTNVIIEDD